MTYEQRGNQISDRSLMGFAVLISLYVAGLVMAGIHGAKLAEVGGLTFDGGLITYAVTFLITDIVSEVYGRQYARKIVIGAFFGLLAAFALTQFALMLPPSPYWEIAGSFGDVLGAGSRVLIAAIATFILSQFVDITVFAWIRRKTGEKHLWLRNNVSTLCGGLVDAIVFSTIAFYGVYDLWPIITSAYLVRIVVSLVDTPIVYAGVYTLHRIYPELKR